MAGNSKYFNQQWWTYIVKFWTRPLLCPIFFIIMQFPTNFGRETSCPPLLGLAPLWKILDPPLAKELILFLEISILRLETNLLGAAEKRIAQKWNDPQLVQFFFKIPNYDSVTCIAASGALLCIEICDSCSCTYVGGQFHFLP